MRAASPVRISIFAFHEHNKSGKSDFAFADGTSRIGQRYFERKFALRSALISRLLLLIPVFLFASIRVLIANERLSTVSVCVCVIYLDGKEIRRCNRPRNSIDWNQSFSEFNVDPVFERDLRPSSRAFHGSFHDSANPLSIGRKIRKRR